jgi:hypothetical protein
MRRDNREFETHEPDFERHPTKFKKHKVKVKRKNRRERPIDHDSLSIQPDHEDR